MTHSMTAFAARDGQGLGHAWAWDMRGVNGKGLDLRLRLPDWIGGLEQPVRAAVQGRVGRGNVTLTLKLARQTLGQDAARIDPAALQALLIRITHVEAAAKEHGLTLRPPSALELLSAPGIADASAPEADSAALVAALLDDLPPLLDAFCEMRATEGAALARVLNGTLDRIAALVTAAEAEAATRQDQMAATLRATLARVLDNAEGADPDRVAQELALIAVKADLREELDRLAAHVDAARALLSGPGPKGRKLDFLTQEFNREANTLCAKAQSGALTRIGLDLKHAIDQMREQVQNVE